MKKISLNIRLIFIFLSVIVTPLNVAANLLTDSNETHFICKFGQDNTTSKDYFLHCDDCIYFFDDLDDVIVHSSYSNISTLLRSHKELKSNFFIASRFTLTLSRAPPTI